MPWDVTANEFRVWVTHSTVTTLRPRFGRETHCPSGQRRASHSPVSTNQAQRMRLGIVSNPSVRAGTHLPLISVEHFEVCSYRLLRVQTVGAFFISSPCRFDVQGHLKVMLTPSWQSDRQLTVRW
jgi:hypothetical protein